MSCCSSRSLWHLVSHTLNFTEQEIMLVVLGLIDVVMISNLLIMVIVGGYETFVSRMELEKHPDQPEWLSHVNASVLKIKLAMAIIGISSIHLLRIFIYAGQLGKEGALYTETGVMWQAIIHGMFILSAIGIAYVERLSEPVYAKKASLGRCAGQAFAVMAVHRSGMKMRECLAGIRVAWALASCRPSPGPTRHFRLSCNRCGRRRRSSACRARRSTRRRAGWSPISRCPICAARQARATAARSRPNSCRRPPIMCAKPRSRGWRRRARSSANEHRATLAAIEQRFGVPPQVILAIWGRETAYGGHKLPHSAVRVLATQAYVGRRKDMFRDEFLLALENAAGGAHQARRHAQLLGRRHGPHPVPAV